MVNIFYHLSIVFPAKSVILLQTPGKILNFNNENTVYSTMLSKERILATALRSILRRACCTVNDKMFVSISLEVLKKSIYPSVLHPLVPTGSALLLVLISCVQPAS